MCATFYWTIFVSVPAVNSCTLEGWDGLEWLLPHSGIITMVQNGMRFDCMFSMLFHWEGLCNLETDDNIAFSLEEKRNICICIFVPVSDHLSKMVTQKEGKLHMRIKITCRASNYPWRGTHWCQVTLWKNACEVSPMSVCVQVTCRPDTAAKSYQEQWRVKNKFWLMNVREWKTCPWGIWSKPCVSSQHPSSHKPIRWSHPAPHSVYILRLERGLSAVSRGTRLYWRRRGVFKAHWSSDALPPG